MNVKKWIVVSGLTWLAIGSWLMFKGLKWITQAITLAEGGPLIRWLTSMTGKAHQSGLVLICVALLIGLIKGRTVLAKAAQRIILRLQSQESPISVTQAYDRRYLVLLSCMMMLGILFRFLPIGLDIRGTIDVAIGSALINGAMIYFREALIPSKA